MKKSFLTLMLTIVSSVWMMSNAFCLVEIEADLTDKPKIVATGIIQLVPLPCDNGTEDDPCPPCLTLALFSGEDMFYLTTDMQHPFYWEYDSLQCPAYATITGVLQNDSSIFVEEIVRTPYQLQSLCNQWNMAIFPFEPLPGETPHFYSYYLSNDSIINGQLYKKLMRVEAYAAERIGVLREGANRDIYFIPEGSTHEYLLYAFNAQVGDLLSNLWIGGTEQSYTEISNITVREITGTAPSREFYLSYTYGGEQELYFAWVEEVGQLTGPTGFGTLPGLPIDPIPQLLCAWGDSGLKYMSTWAKEHGCYGENSTADTIPLYSYTGDDPGTSTVDPVDPNQVVATLENEELTIREYTGTEITYVLTHRNNAPSRELEPQPTTFENEVVIELTEYGPYELQLSNETWDYIIIGKFYYGPQGVEMIGSDLTADGVQKVIIDGQLLLLKGDKTYTLTGQEIKL